MTYPGGDDRQDQRNQERQDLEAVEVAYADQAGEQEASGEGATLDISQKEFSKALICAYEIEKPH